MHKLGVLALLSAVGFAFGAAACGGSAASQFGDPPPPTPVDNGVPAGASLGEIGPNGTGSACVTEVANAGLTPTNLVFMIDKSGSMGDAASGFNPAERWVPVTSAVKSFFSDPYSKTVRSSLQFFPIDDDTIDTACNAPYAEPSVALTMASDPAFLTALDTTRPSGGTPTLPALAGAIAYAKTVAKDRPLDKTAVVFVSDGEPGFYDPTQKAFVPGCADNDVAHAAAAAQTAYATDPKVPTYVIGVGPKLEALSSIATAGGTTAIMVDTVDPTKTNSDIVNALDAIRRREVSCDFTIPPSPAGKELDPFAINVVLTGADATESVLSYSKECSATKGWHYDDPVTPKRILLCSAACEDARASSAGKVSIAFGCKTRIDVN
jgi:Mg-chelatase subunit ChlD